MAARLLPSILLCATACGAQGITPSQLQTPKPGIVAEMRGGVRSGKALPGQKVRLKLHEAFLEQGKVVPRGATLLGKVFVSEKGTKGKPSILGVTVNRARWRGGSVAMRGYVVGEVVTVLRVHERGTSLGCFARRPWGRVALGGWRDGSPMSDMMGDSGNCRQEDQTIVPQPIPRLKGVLLVRAPSGAAFFVSKDKPINLNKGMRVVVEPVE